jgi:hypothetical protein|tara:strand:+ start:1145 stop:1285 length:141 start_codon:yes stop_codon:yes gene_type:complete
MPTGMTLSSSGLVSWDVRDSVLCSGCSQNDVNDVDGPMGSSDHGRR